MPLKDLLKKKEKIKASDTEPISSPPSTISTQDPDLPPKPEFTFLRSDTNTQELISPPAYPDEQVAPDSTTERATAEKLHSNRFSKRFSRLGNHSSPSKEKETEKEKDATATSPPTSRPTSKDKDSRRLSQRLHISPRSRNTSQSSANIPSDLPEIGTLALGTGQQNEEKQAAWEERATILVKDNPNNRPLSRPSSNRSSTNFSRPSTPKPETQPDFHPAHLGDRAPRGRSISDAKSDDDIQAAIRLHESGNLAESTAMFGRLADNKSNAMAQILYGLALRHGWGIEPNPGLGITYLSRAATMSADVESDALAKGVKKGGAAKGELVLAIYELANSFRHGWGVEKDPLAARKYYEVAANLGDTDAMNECGWCYDEGYGGKKDRYTAAQYYRRAEQQGSKTLGNSWIWKDKYDPDHAVNQRRR
ncbi:MAG: hypothetical protein OHK93_002636 [Ramalina farinacea]|uniref:HCP-like protein n=1 Tax=Ramalina farinacea TaxID=258253 RepID=A0AA43QRY6_9LECA|nr:hypothetical protein [Ramalina farinacea]